MESSEVYLLLTPQIRRLLVVYKVLWFCGLVATAVVLIIPPARPWLLAIGPLSVGCGVARMFIKKRALNAMKVSWMPRLVYWTHPRPIYRRDPDSIEDCSAILIHLRDGESLWIDLPKEQMRGFLDWLREKNPSVRLGNYDGVDPFTGEDMETKINR